ncbi:WYL domain-containing protein [Phaeobacter sp.]|uniref:helix-turn-helix transcriptional regulator n=1 Tax=Phaeobacter sp. TaxID=1902409 RepID=UPI0025E9267C|nr:WYL domain-containing protein [Phaeobacter sp.]
MTSHHRHDAILRHLRRNVTTTVSELAADVGVSRRTVLRDLCALRDAGFVIHSDVGRGGGLHLDPQSVQTTARLRVPEVFALLISVAAMRAAGQLPFSDLADAGLAKIEQALPADQIRDLRRFLDRLHVGQLSPLQDLTDMGTMDPELLSVFQQGFLQQHCLRFQYRDGQGRFSERKVEPQAMLILPPLWYLVAWDPVREDFRHFRMDRISRPQALEDTHFRPRHVPFEADVCPFHAKVPPSR